MHGHPPLPASGKCVPGGSEGILLRPGYPAAVTCLLLTKLFSGNDINNPAGFTVAAQGAGHDAVELVAEIATHLPDVAGRRPASGVTGCGHQRHAGGIAQSLHHRMVTDPNRNSTVLATHPVRNLDRKSTRLNSSHVR